MIKVAALKQRQKQKQQKMMDLKLKRITQELSEENFNISDENCLFEISPKICVKNNFVSILVRARPCVGLFSSIDFLITIFIEQSANFKSPRVYNDRRIFHPNINPYTFEVAVPEIIHWNPTNTLVYLLRRLKYTLIEPNTVTIPNNQLSRRAAYLYKIDRENYRNYIIQYCPTVLDGIVLKQKNTQCYNSFDINQLQENQSADKSSNESKYIEIGDILPLSRVRQEQNNEQFDDGFDFLNKRFSRMRIQSLKQNQNYQPIIDHVTKHSETVYKKYQYQYNYLMDSE